MARTVNVYRCVVCGHAIADGLVVVVVCSHGDESGPMHGDCADGWQCASDARWN